MEEHFKEKFQEKTDNDLQFILDHEDRYQTEAISAAQHILENRKIAGIKVFSEPLKRSSKPKLTENSNRLDPEEFMRTLSYREFLTSFGLGLLLLSVYEFFDYYSSENFVKNNSILILVITFVSLLSLNHVFYRFEHRRSNNFIGRILHDAIFIVIFLIVKSIYLSIIKLEASSAVTIDTVPFWIFLFFFTIPIEGINGILKRLLKLLKCEIL